MACARSQPHSALFEERWEVPGGAWDLTNGCSACYFKREGARRCWGWSSADSLAGLRLSPSRLLRVAPYLVLPFHSVAFFNGLLAGIAHRAAPAVAKTLGLHANRRLECAEVRRALDGRLEAA